MELSTEERNSLIKDYFTKELTQKEIRNILMCRHNHIVSHRRLCRVKNLLAMYLKYHKAGLTPTTPVTSIAISSVKMSIGRKSLTNLRSEMIFLQGKPVFYIFLPYTFLPFDRKAEICRT